MADGTRLSGDLYRPAGAEPGPVLVSYYPYRKDDIIGSLFEGCRIRLCERGYASVFVDMAGTGASEGSWESFDLCREGRDCAEVIEWVAEQEWCDGNVGAWGTSYGGMTALAAAARRPAHLRAIVATYATTDVFRDSIDRGGCATMLGRYAWSAHNGRARPVPADPARSGRPVAPDVAPAAAAPCTGTAARRGLAGPPGAGRLLAGPPGGCCRHRHTDDADRRLVRHLRRRHDPALRRGARAEATGDGSVDARAAAPVRRGAVRLGGGDGGLVGRSPATWVGIEPRAGGAGPVLRRRRGMAGRPAVAARGRGAEAAVPLRAPA